MKHAMARRVERSLRNVRRTRGENCELASWSTRIVIEKTSPVNVIIDEAIVESSERALLAWPGYRYQAGWLCGISASARGIAFASSTATIAAAPGTTHKLVLRLSRS